MLLRSKNDSKYLLMSVEMLPETTTVPLSGDLQESQHGNEAEIHLAQCFGRVDIGSIDTLTGPVGIMMLVVL